MRCIGFQITKRDVDLIGLVSEIGIKNFKKIVWMNLRSLTDPSEYDDKKLKKILQSQEKCKLNLPVTIEIVISSKKDEDLLKFLNTIKGNTSLGYFAKVSTRNFLGYRLYKYFFKGNPEFFDLDKRAIPILKSAKIKNSVKVITETQTVKVTTETQTVKEKTKSKTVKETKPSYSEPLPIESAPITEESSQTDDEEFDALSMLEMILD